MARNHETQNFNMVWQNDYDVYHLVLGQARALLRSLPSMTDQTLGRNLKDYVFALRNGGGYGHPDGFGSPRIRHTLQWIGADTYGGVSEEDVAEDVRELLGIEWPEEYAPESEPVDEGGGWHDTTADNLNTSGSIGFSVFEQ